MVARIHAITPASGAPEALPPAAFSADNRPDPRRLPIKVALLLVWAFTVFGAMFFARDLQSVQVWGWPLGYWLASQGIVLLFLAIVLVHALLMGWIDRQTGPCTSSAIPAVPSPHD